MTTEPLYLLSGKAWGLVALFLLLIAVVGAVIGFATAPLATWLWLDVAFVVFIGLANGMLAWVAIFRTAQVRWTPSIYRVAESAMAFVPVLAAVLVALLAGAYIYMPWVAHPVPGVRAWLNLPFFIIRELVLLGALWLVMLIIVRMGLKADVNPSLADPSNRRYHYKLNVLGTIGVWIYVIASSVVAFDFIMSLTPKWASTVFGAYFFCTNVLAAMALLVILSTAALKSEPARKYLNPQQFKDMGNLMLAFALFDMGLFYAQYLTIWYENLPRETDFILVRYMYGGWPYLGWTSLIIGYGIPFVLLQSRYIKTHAKLLSGVSVLILIGFALERYVLVMPSLWPHNLLPFPAGVLFFPGLAGAFILCVRWFTRRYAAVSSVQEALREANNPEAVHSL